MLRVTKLTDYATVVLTVLAAQHDRVLSAAELAERAGLEAPTVSKVLKPLAQAGLVEGFRGANGGYRLARPADEIGLIEVVEAMEGPLGMTECSLHEGQCGLERQCGVRANWRRINDVVVEALSNVTLAQMLAPAPAFASPLSTEPAANAKRIDLRLAGA
ncbi:SUF system Fe-S cluster assembly regulator [Lysobacter enzymogenes]|uniref:SUF system Fe-S cluster assembly regulator n=1 Tax=Lysobacter enzymogenes TaxID=69 RepID=A0A3N2RC35_LYSEN|nr:SUF system Fe-S cluster assembly regulator [Lysobacter enzymogenes]ROU05032.1 SUF system Fe-S cluster assembly regulator [Lysobacter enzymogenes]